MAIAWEMKPFTADDADTLMAGGGTAATATTAAKNAADGTASCTSSVGYTVKKDSKNVVVTAMKTAGIKLGDGGAFGTVTATQSTTAGVKNAADTDAAGGTCGSGECIANGLGVYGSVKNPGEMFIWGLSIKAASAAAADGAAAADDKKKSATTLAIGAAAGLVAAAIA